jgi:hypothetical protein
MRLPRAGYRQGRTFHLVAVLNQVRESMTAESSSEEGPD